MACPASSPYPACSWASCRMVGAAPPTRLGPRRARPEPGTEPSARATSGSSPRAANNSVDGGVLIPTVVFGIPGSGGMAIVLAILILTGITPGPLMLTQHLDLTVSMVYTIAFANLVVVPIMLAFAPTLCRIAVIPPNILAPVVWARLATRRWRPRTLFGRPGAVLAFGLCSS